MPSELPRITGDEAIKAFCKADFYVARVTGSHHILKKDGHRLLVNIPRHCGKVLGLGLLKKQIENAGMTVDQFIDLL